ncbi:MAG TPA: ATP phosphoribosyltransferase regulatory subunit, partial [Gemmatimonadales bacterium]|nr:ATP phosphoribosyltransferase regulatory subunit [Gemmatimonadales bacterium]
PSAALAAAYQFIDRIERLRRDEIDRFTSEASAVAPATVTDLMEISQIKGWAGLEAELARSDAARAAAAPLRATYAALEAMGLAEFVDVDLSIVRGLLYYTGTVFELFDAGRTLRAICGGGRYDTLLAALGGVDLPALGFGMGDVVLAELLKERGLGPAATVGLDVFVAAATEADLPRVLALAHDLRDAGLRVEYPLAAGPLRKQLDLAAARRARYAVVVGPDEWARGEVVLRNLQERDKAKAQRAVPRDAVAAEIMDNHPAPYRHG